MQDERCWCGTGKQGEHANGVQGHFANKINATLQIRTVEDRNCPTCDTGIAQGFHNRPKVEMNGVWWWRCYNPTCETSYYDPITGETGD